MQHTKMRCEIIATAPVTIIEKSKPVNDYGVIELYLLKKPLFDLIAVDAILLAACVNFKGYD